MREQSLAEWMTEELVLEATRMVNAQRLICDQLELREHLSVEDHMLAVEARRVLRRLSKSRTRLKKDLQMRLF